MSPSTFFSPVDEGQLGSSECPDAGSVCGMKRIGTAADQHSSLTCVGFKFFLTASANRSPKAVYLLIKKKKETRQFDYGSQLAMPTGWRSIQGVETAVVGDPSLSEISQGTSDVD